MFYFRLITTQNGMQIIDESLKTPFVSLTNEEMEDYIQTDKALTVINRIKKRKAKEELRRRKLAHNPIYKLACICGMVC